MTLLRRLVAISILMVSLSGAALAEGGDTHGPPAPPPAPPESADYSVTEASTQTEPAQDPTVDIVTTAEVFAAWLAQTIL